MSKSVGVPSISTANKNGIKKALVDIDSYLKTLLPIYLSVPFESKVEMRKHNKLLDSLLTTLESCGVTI